MWGTREVLERLERRVKDVEVLLKEFTDAMVLDGRKLYDRLNKLENKVDTLGLKERRITTLEQQVVDAMNREEEWNRRLAKIETGMFVDQMKVDEVWKEEPKDVELEPRVGDLVVSTENPTDIRKVLANGSGLQVVRKTDIKMYNRGDLVKDFMSEWHVIARREDLK